MAEKEKLSSTQVIEEQWDKKKIALAIGVLALLAAGFIAVRSYILPKSISPQPTGKSHSVQGLQTSTVQNTDTITPGENTISLPSANDVQQKIQDIQQQVTHLNLQDIASSSPQVQQVLQQIESLPQVPANVAKEACINICNKL